MNHINERGGTPGPRHDHVLQGYAYSAIDPGMAASQRHGIDEGVESYRTPTLTGSPPSIRRKQLHSKPTFIAETVEHVQSPSNGPENPIRLAQWSMYWRTPSTMVVLFVCGIVFALAHHFYYNSLEGQFNTSQDSQEWAVRIGTGLAFLAKASLCAAAAMAYRQYSWLRMRKRPTTIGGIDSILGSLEDFSALVDIDMLRQSKMTTLLAILIWWAQLSRPNPNQ